MFEPVTIASSNAYYHCIFLSSLKQSRIFIYFCCAISPADGYTHILSNSTPCEVTRPFFFIPHCPPKLSMEHLSSASTRHATVDYCLAIAQVDQDSFTRPPF